MAWWMTNTPGKPNTIPEHGVFAAGMMTAFRIINQHPEGLGKIIKILTEERKVSLVKGSQEESDALHHRMGLHILTGEMDGRSPDTRPRRADSRSNPTRPSAVAHQE